MRKDDSFTLDLALYSDMILMLGKNKLIEMAENLFGELKKEGVQPDTRVYTEMIGIYLKVGMVDKAMDMYKMMKDSGCNPDRLTLTILIRYLDKAGEEDLACAVRKDCEKYIEYPERFLEELDKSYVSISQPAIMEIISLPTFIYFVQCRTIYNDAGAKRMKVIVCINMI